MDENIFLTRLSQRNGNLREDVVHELYDSIIEWIEVDAGVPDDRLR